MDKNDGYNAFDRKCAEDDIFSIELDLWSDHVKKSEKKPDYNRFVVGKILISVTHRK